jgi:hypothetical protein
VRPFERDQVLHFVAFLLRRVGMMAPAALLLRGAVTALLSLCAHAAASDKRVATAALVVDLTYPVMACQLARLAATTSVPC